MSRLQEFTLDDFTGGLNLRRNEFQLQQNESPDMLNAEVDPRGGFSTRNGWSRWNSADIIGSPTGANWDPRHAHMHRLASGSYIVYLASEGQTYAAPSSATFASLSLTNNAAPHGADFASWGDVVYIARGNTNQSYKRDGTAAAASLTQPGNGTYNDDYTTPAGGFMPQAEFVEAHGDLLFTASIREDEDGGGQATYPNRLRWSHPNEPEDWAQLDRLDINIGGGAITGLKSFRDHLLIFKTDSVWALYGYGTDSHQLVSVSRTLGAPQPGAITRSPTACFFYSASGRPGIYAWIGGEEPIHISEPLTEALDEISDSDDVWVAWGNRRLWVSVPWNGDDDSLTYPGTAFIFDPEVGSTHSHTSLAGRSVHGSWVMHRPALGKLNCFVEGADAVLAKPMAAIHGDSGAAAMMLLDDNDSVAHDLILDDSSSTDFSVRYRTPWVFVGWAERDKSWRRPKFTLDIPPTDVTILLDVYTDYNETVPTYAQRIEATGESGGVWGTDTWGAFEWGAAPVGSKQTRTVVADGLGVNKAVSLCFKTATGEVWGISSATMKYVLRRYTT